jgi:hypothetical protein
MAASEVLEGRSDTPQTETPPAGSPGREAWHGLRDTLPFMFGSIPFGVIFGTSRPARPFHLGDDGDVACSSSPARRNSFAILLLGPDPGFGWSGSQPSSSISGICSMPRPWSIMCGI